MSWDVLARSQHFVMVNEEFNNARLGCESQKTQTQLGLDVAIHLRSLYTVKVILLGLGCLQKS